MIGYMDRPLLGVWIAALAFGGIMVASASVALEGNYVIKHAFYVAAGIVGFGVMCVLPLKLFEKMHRLAWLAAVALCVAVLIPGIGIEANGSQRWIGVGGITIQPSEWVKLFVVIYLAGYLARFDSEIKDQPWVMVRPLLMIAVIAGLLLAGRAR